MDSTILFRTVRWSLGIASAAALVAACAEGQVDFEDDGNETNEGGGAAAGGSGGTTTTNNPCGQDCSTIQTPPCYQSVCNDGSYPGPVNTCVVVPGDAGSPCDDGMFCTTNDACDGAGMCVGGPQNTCGLEPTACEQVSCNEGSQSCALLPKGNGDPCTPDDLCEVGGQCTNGLCVGVPVDCFFSPVPNECYVAECNPANGQCEPVVGPDGAPCTDPTELCTVDKTCVQGVCQGGSPKDCSSLTVGCFNGVCDVNSGQCISQPVPVGGSCDAAADYCNDGECDANGNCLPVPTNEGGACEDGNPCTAGETCASGSCTGGTSVNQVIYFEEEFANNTQGWTLGTEWQIGPATSSPSPGSCGAGDPGTDTTANGNNGVAGVVIGGNASTALHSYYYLTSPPVNTSSAPGSVWLGFHRWLNSDYTRFMANRVEVFDGTTWHVLWETGSSAVQDPAWVSPSPSPMNVLGQTAFDVTPYKNTNMQVRFGFMIGSSGVYTCSQWNVDDVLIANVICQ